MANRGFELTSHDVTFPIVEEVDSIYSSASPAAGHPVELGEL
jgi:hypothetical protein